jgi:hypothetical protein
MVILRLLRSHICLISSLIVLLGPANVYSAQHTPMYPHVHRVYAGSVNGFDVWIVDGKTVRETLIPEFLYGGNPQVYPSIPVNEIWIDHAISCEEYNYTLMHELCERELMAVHGWAYGPAHDSALALERTHRSIDLRSDRDHERLLPRVGTTDYYGEKEVPALGDSLQLGDVYRIHVGNRDSIDIWIVDGAAIRRDIYPDFGLSGNDLAYHFIPRREIWLDAQISCEEMEFSIQFELTERAFIAEGEQYDDAYVKALKISRDHRLELERDAAKIAHDQSPESRSHFRWPWSMLAHFRSP